MNCEQCQPLVGEYVAGELAADETGAMSAHLGFCVPCRGFYEEERREQEIYSRYLLAVRPDAAMWSKLEARIEREPSASRVIRFRCRVSDVLGEPHTGYALRIAAALLLMVGGALTLVTYTARRHTVIGERGTEITAGSPTDRSDPRLPDVPDVQQQERRDTIIGVKPNAEVAAPTLVVLARVRDDRRGELGTTRRAAALRSVPRRAPMTEAIRRATPGDVVSEAESQHLEAIRLLTRDIAARGAEATSESTTHYTEALQTIDKVIDDTRRAVRTAPNDPVAVQHLLAAYDRKIDVLEELASREN